MENKDINIKSYDGTDAYYEGTDKDYEDFLKSVDGNINTEASPVSDESNAGVSGETINIRSVLDKVKQKAAKFVNDFKSAQTADNDEGVPQEEIVFDDDDDVEIIKENITLGAKSAKEHIKNISESAKQKLDGIKSTPSELTDKIDAMASKLNEIEVKQIETKSDMDINIKDIGTRLDTLTAQVSDVHQSVTLVSKLNDRMFEIKNAQQNMKKDFEDLETAITTLKKKQVTTATVMSLLSIVIIVLEIVNLLS